MAEKWRVYSRPRKRSDEPVAKASINTRGEISMNYEAWRRLKEPYIVTLWYNSGDRQISIRVLDAEEKKADAFIVRPWGKSGGRVVRVQRMFTACRIKIAKRLIFTNPEIEYGRIILSLRFADYADKTERRKGATMDDGYFW